MEESLCIPAASPASCTRGAHLLAGLMATGLEHSRNGVSIADRAEVLLAGGLQGAECRVGWGWTPRQVDGDCAYVVCSCANVYVGGVQLAAVAPLTREAAAAWADAEVRWASICSTWASSSVLM